MQQYEGSNYRQKVPNLWLFLLIKFRSMNFDALKASVHTHTFLMEHLKSFTPQLPPLSPDLRRFCHHPVTRIGQGLH